LARARTVAWMVGLVALGASASAVATVLEPDGKLEVPIAQEESTDYFDQYRFTVSTLGLGSLLDAREGVGAIDYRLDAASEPATLVPGCRLEAALVLRGGSCALDFGWYCVDHPDELHPLITRADVIYYHDTVVPTLDDVLGPPPEPLNSWTDYMNNDKGFVPTVQMPPVTSAPVNVREDPAFSPESCPSQRIGFAIVGNPKSFCPQTKYSEQVLNQICSLAECDGQSWASAVMYRSVADPDAMYFAFEDLPTTATRFDPTLTSLKPYYPDMKQPDGWDGQNDGDMNDQVFFVRNAPCPGDVEATGGAGGGASDALTAGAGGMGGAAGTAAVDPNVAGSAGRATARADAGPGADASAGGRQGETGGTGSDAGASLGGTTAAPRGHAGESDDQGGAPDRAEARAGSGPELTVCEPGRQVACSCTDGANGAQRCSDQGTAWEPCVCEAAQTNQNASDDGCGCRIVSSRQHESWAAVLALLAVVSSCRRSGRVARSRSRDVR
jgi:hypothetical protein